MFKKATKSELRTWMLCDIIIVIISICVSISMLMKYVDEEKTSHLVWGLILLFIGILLLFFFWKMIIAFTTYNERMAEFEKQKAEVEEI